MEMENMIFLNQSNAPKESNYLSLNIDKAIKQIKMEAILNLDETIDYTIDWYKNYNSNNVFEFCINQINRIRKFMEFKKRKLEGIFEIQLNPILDKRGFFMRTYDLELIQ